MKTDHTLPNNWNPKIKHRKLDAQYSLVRVCYRFGEISFKKLSNFLVFFRHLDFIHMILVFRHTDTHIYLLSLALALLIHNKQKKIHLDFQTFLLLTFW
jgi:hypothetical protein